MSNYENTGYRRLCFDRHYFWVGSYISGNMNWPQINQTETKKTINSPQSQTIIQLQYSNKIMLKLASALALLTASTSAFSSTRSTMRSTRSSPTALFYHPPTFDRAVECANEFGLCDVDELLNLAEDM